MKQQDNSKNTPIYQKQCSIHNREFLQFMNIDPSNTSYRFYCVDCILTRRMNTQKMVNLEELLKKDEQIQNWPPMDSVQLQNVLNNFQQQEQFKENSIKQIKEYFDILKGKIIQDLNNIEKDLLQKFETNVMNYGKNIQKLIDKYNSIYDLSKLKNILKTDNKQQSSLEAIQGQLNEYFQTTFDKQWKDPEMVSLVFGYKQNTFWKIDDIAQKLEKYPFYQNLNKLQVFESLEQGNLENLYLPFEYNSGQENQISQSRNENEYTIKLSSEGNEDPVVVYSQPFSKCQNLIHFKFSVFLGEYFYAWGGELRKLEEVYIGLVKEGEQNQHENKYFLQNHPCFSICGYQESYKGKVLKIKYFELENSIDCQIDTQKNEILVFENEISPYKDYIQFKPEGVNFENEIWRLFIAIQSNEKLKNPTVLKFQQ